MFIGKAGKRYRIVYGEYDCMITGTHYERGIPYDLLLDIGIVFCRDNDYRFVIFFQCIEIDFITAIRVPEQLRQQNHSNPVLNKTVDQLLVKAIDLRSVGCSFVTNMPCVKLIWYKHRIMFGQECLKFL